MAKKIIDVKNQTVTFDFGDEGQSVLELAKVPEETKIMLMLHGGSQKGGDSYAGAASAVEELDMTAEAWAKAQVDSVIATLYAGDWSTRTGASGTGVTDLARALHEVSGTTDEDRVSLDDCVAYLEEKTKEQKAKLRKDPRVEAVLTRLRRERAEAKEKQAAEKAAKAGPATDLFD